MLRMICAGAAMLVASAAYAVDCDSPVVDEGHIISDSAQVEQAARRLANSGATVRVRTFDEVGGKSNLDRRIVELRNQCRDWQSPDGHGWKSTMLVLAYASEGHQKGVYYGPAVQAKVGDGKWINVLRTSLAPLETAYWAGERSAMMQGIVASLGGLQSLMMATPGGGNVVINNSTSTDYSKVWMIFFLLLGCGSIGFGFWLWSGERSKSSAAQREARRVRALCVSGLSEISSQTTEDVLASIVESEIDEARKAAGQLMLRQFKQLVGLASNSLSQFDGDSDAKLSEAACNSNKRLYMQIIDKYINPAKLLMGSIKAREFTTVKKESPKRRSYGYPDLGYDSPVPKRPAPTPCS